MLMYKKSCPYCKEESFSAAPQGKWECPYCHADLTVFIPEPAGGALPRRQSVRFGDYPDGRLTHRKNSGPNQIRLLLLIGGKTERKWKKKKI